MGERHQAFAIAAACMASAASAQTTDPLGEIRAVELGWIEAVAPDEWCGTTQRYRAELAARGLDPLAGLCPPLGPCDDPVMRDAFVPDIGTPIKTVRLSIHIFCETDGGNCTATPADVDAAVARLNADYAPWGFQFVHEVEFVNSSRYRDVTDGDDGMMKHRYADSPGTMLNIYVVNTGGVSWGTFPWSEYAQTFYGGIVIDDAWFGAGTFLPTILTHEVGHCLGLWHVFHGVDEVPVCGDCYETAGRSGAEGDVTGDFCSDTNPTPKNTNNCFDPPEPDACSGNPWLGTPYLNYMSYSHTCPIEFSAHQAGRMQCWTEDVLSGWLAPPPPPNVPGTPVLTSQGGGQVLVAWEDNSGNETGFQVERARKSGKKWVETQIVASVGPDVTSITDSPGSGTYRYRVRAYNGDGSSAWSAWAEITN